MAKKRKQKFLWYKPNRSYAVPASYISDMARNYAAWYAKAKGKPFDPIAAKLNVYWSEVTP